MIAAFTRAIQKGLDYCNSHSAEEIAAVIAPQFPENTQNDIAVIVARYQDTWKTDTVFSKESFTLLTDIFETAASQTRMFLMKTLSPQHIPNRQRPNLFHIKPHVKFNSAAFSFHDLKCRPSRSRNFLLCFACL